MTLILAPTLTLTMQAAGTAGSALVERDSDSDDELEPYNEDADRWEEEDEVSPEDESALAAFMVRELPGFEGQCHQYGEGTLARVVTRLTREGRTVGETAGTGCIGGSASRHQLSILNVVGGIS